MKKLFFTALMCVMTFGNVWNVGERGYYWSSTPEEGSDEDAYHLSFQSNGFTISDQDRCEGNSVHLVI